MTDHLAEARAAIHAEHGWSMAAPASSLADMASAIAHILDHLEAQQTDASIRFADDEPDPLDEDNHTDRIDRDGYRWVWCVGCDGLRIDGHEVHRSGYGWSTFWIDKVRGPLTFAPRPAGTPTAAPQPDKAHGDAPDPARPAERHTDNIRAEAWDEGRRAGRREALFFQPNTPNPYRKDRA